MIPEEQRGEAHDGPETFTGVASLAGFAVLGVALALCLAWAWSRVAGLLVTALLVLGSSAAAVLWLLLRRARRRASRGDAITRRARRGSAPGAA